MDDISLFEDSSYGEDCDEIQFSPEPSHDIQDDHITTFDDIDIIESDAIRSDFMNTYNNDETLPSQVPTELQMDQFNRQETKEINRIRVITWNIANHFNDGLSLKRLFLAGNYSYMALQEPTRKYNPETIEFT